MPMTTGAPPSGQELDEALARAIRQLIASAAEADGWHSPSESWHSPGEAPDTAWPAA